MTRMKALSTDGVVWVDIIDTAEESDISMHWSAVHKYLESGDTEGLHLLEGVGIGMYWLETDPAEIEFWVETGLLDFRDLRDEEE